MPSARTARPAPSVGEQNHRSSAESKHSVQVGALDRFVDNAILVDIRTDTGAFYPDATIVRYDQFTIAAVWRGKPILFYKHAIESISER